MCNKELEAKQDEEIAERIKDDINVYINDIKADLDKCIELIHEMRDELKK